ncbi:hypothetical protein OCAR_6328 [Afipia carboxidovorans OM5]|nr:hypothetical protein OCAR_6328 [Afipia carboxidovorans OM5]
MGVKGLFEARQRYLVIHAKSHCSITAVSQPEIRRARMPGGSSAGPGGRNASGGKLTSD